MKLLNNRCLLKAVLTPRAWVLALLLGLLMTTHVEAAENTLYAITNNSPFTIYSVDASSGAASPIGNLTFSSAAIARHPTSGLIYYTALNPNGSGRYLVATWDPATSTNTTLSGTIGVYLPRLAFKADGTLYGMDSNNNLYTLNTATGAVLTTVGTVSGGGLPTGLGGDMAFAPDGTLYLIAGTNLYTISGTTSSLVGNTGTTTPAGLSFGNNGELYTSDTTAGNSRIYKLSTANGGATLVGSSGAALSDMAGLPKYANLSLTKAASGSFVVGATGTYVLTVGNAGPQSASGPITITDTLPAGLSYSSFTGPANWSCGAVGQVVTCSNPNTFAVGGSAVINLTVSILSAAAPSVTNSATVSSPTFDPSTANNTGSATTAVRVPADLTIDKSHAGNFTQGQIGTYNITVTNSGAGPTNASITVTDTLPAGLSYSSFTGTPSWSCGAIGQAVTCTNSTIVNAGANYPALAIQVLVAGNAPFSLTNTASVAGGGEIATGNNSDSDPTTVNGVPDLTVTKSHAGSFTRGSIHGYTITVTNSGTASTSGMVTVTDTLPAGLSYSSFATAPAWSCGVVGQVVTCTRSDALGVGISYSALTINVLVEQNAAASVTNSVSVSGGGQTNTANDSATDATNIVSRSDLSLTKTVNNATPTINTNVTYTVTLSNGGPTDATGITVKDLLPAGLNFVSATPSTGSYVSGTGLWTVASLASGASATLQIVAKVTVSGTITNTAEVTAAGQTDPDSTPGNNISSEDDQASVNVGAPAPPSIGLLKTVSPTGTVLPGTELTYTINFSNTGGSPAQNFIIFDPDLNDVDVTQRVFKNIDFKVGSLTTALGTTGLTVTVEYSNNGGATWIYNPTSGTGGAPAGFDRTVTNIRLSFGGSLSHIAPNNAGSIQFTVRIR